MSMEPTTEDRLSPAALRPLLEFIAQLDLRNPKEAQAELQRHFPHHGEFVLELRDALRDAVAAGRACYKGQPPVQFSRLFAASGESHNLSADAVLMSAPGPLHVHPNGEIDLCFVEEGEPRFDGHGEGWVVYGPGSRHVPTVKGGRMLILYLLPGGAIEFVK